MSKKINSCFLRVSILFCLGSISSPAAPTTNVLSTWTPTNNDFNNAANWSPNGALTLTNVAFFSGPASNSLSPQLTANSTIYGLNFTNTAIGYTISTANNSVLTLSSAYGFTTNALSTAPAIWAQNTTGTNRISAGVALAANTSTWNQAKGGTLEVTGNISESGASRQLTLASGVGTGTTSYYYLSGSNSYTGATVIASGALLTLGSANVLGTTAGATTISGTIDLNGYSITGEAITGGGTGTDGASGFLVNNSATAASVTGSTLALSSSGNYIGGTGNMTIGSAISGAATNALTKVGTGEITLAGNNTYAGLITVSVGTLTLSGNNSGASSSISLGTGAVLNINSANALGTGSLTTSSSGATINNTSGSAVINAGTNAISLGNITTFGTTSSTTNNNLDLGTGTVTTASSPVINFAGTNTTLKMGLLDSTVVATNATGSRVTATNSGSGIGNTLSFAGFKLGSQVTNAVVDSIYGNANVTFRGAIVNGAAYNNGILIANTATTTFAGDNTYTGLTTMNAAAGTLTLSGNNSAASGGVTLTAGTLNINNNNALGSGTVTLTAGTINNTSGGAVANAVNNAVTWGGDFTFGTAGSTNSSSNLNLGAGIVTTTTSRGVTFAGTNTTLKMGAVNITSIISGRTITANGAGNTLEMGGLTLTANTTNAVTVTLAGTANINVTGAIVNGQNFANGLLVTNVATTTLSGNNTYTGLTTMNAAAGTLTLSGNNSAASGGVTLTAGTLNINNNNALGSGTVTLTAGTINNTSGGAVANAVNNAVTWGGDFTFGTAGSTNSSSNLNLGAGIVTTTTSRGVTFAGTNTTLKMGAVNITSIISGRTITANGAGNTLEMGGLTLTANTTNAVTVTLAGTANINVTGAIVNGQNFANGLLVTNVATTTLSGNNTYTGLTTMNASGGTLTLSGNNSAASGGVRVTAGIVNVNSTNALGTGTLTLDGTGATINNTSGAALTNANNNAVTWDGSSGIGFTFGTSASGALNNLNLGTGTVTAGSTRIMNFAGNGTTLTMGALDFTTSSSTDVTALTINGEGNTLVLGGYKIRSVVPGTPSARNDSLAGTANLTITGEIQNGNIYSNGLKVKGTGVTTFSGNNTYDGLTKLDSASGTGTLTLSGNNSGAAGGVELNAGTLNINNVNALGSGVFSLAGSNSISGANTINNTSGSAVVNAGNNAVTFSSSGLNFGTSGSTTNNNLDLGIGTVTVDGSRVLNLLGTGTTLKMGTLENTATGTGKEFTFNGSGNTMIFRGYNISTNASSAVTNNLTGSANLTISGVIANGNILANGVNIKGTGTTTFSGANTYTGGTEVFTGATLLYGANDVTSDTGGQMAVSGTLDIASYNDTVSSVKVSAGGLLRGTTGTLTASSFSLYGSNTVSAILGGSAATLLKSTSDTVTLLSGANTYGGKTTVTSGTLKLGSSTALGITDGTTNTATYVSSGGFLDLNGQTAVAETLNYTGTGGLLNSAAGTTATVSGAVDIGTGMTVETTGNITLSGQLTGSVSKNLIKSGAGTLKFTAAGSSYTGTNTVSAGTLLVDTGASVTSSKSVVNNGGLLNVNGTAGGVTVNNGGSLGGSGMVGAVTLNSGGLLNPGNSPGTLTAASAIVMGGSTYNWQITSLTGTAGTNWDLLSVTGLLNMTGVTSSNKWNLVVTADNGFAGWTDTTSYSYVFAQAATLSLASGFSTAAGTDVTSLFNITASGINSLPNSSYNANGDFKVEVGSAGSLTTLKLMAIPEPSTGALLGFGFGGLVFLRMLRRRNS